MVQEVDSNNTAKRKLNIVYNIEDLNEDEWGNFVLKHPKGNIYQTPEFFRVCQKTPLYQPLLVVLKNGEQIEGLLLSNIQKQFNGLVGNFSTRSVVIGGPIIKEDNAEVFDILLKYYNEIIEKKAIYSQFRNIFNLWDLTTIFNNNNYQREPHLNITVDLTKTEDELWKDINKKAKNRIRAAQKKGIKFKVENTQTALEECYKILKKVYSRIKLPLAKFEYFLNLYNIFNNKNSNFIIFTVQLEGRIIGCLFAIGYKDKVYGLYNGADYDYYDKNPNDLIPWEIFQWAKKNGFKTFDWQGAGKPGIPYGVRDYKMKFGGNLIELGRFEKINKPLLYKIGELGLATYKYYKKLNI